MGVWAAWSLLRFVPSAELHVYSDGTLDNEDRAIWQRVIPGVTFTTGPEREERVADGLADFPTLAEWRRRQFYGIKFIDPHVCSQTDRLLLLDSDVLCFQRPDEVLAALAAPESTQRWNQDGESSYSASPAQLREILGIDVPARANAGFMLTKRWTREDLAYFERTLNQLADAGVSIHDRWAEQMLYAIAAHRHESAASLSARYAITLGRTSPDAVIRHYVGVPRVRPRFHTEGVPRLLAQL